MCNNTFIGAHTIMFSKIRPYVLALLIFIYSPFALHANEGWKKVVSDYSESVAYIKVMKSSSGEDTIYSTGSGFIISESGLIITNKHVIERAQKYSSRYYVEVQFSKIDQDPKKASIVAFSLSNDHLVHSSSSRTRK